MIVVISCFDVFSHESILRVVLSFYIYYCWSLEEIVESLIGMTMTLVLVEDLVHEGSFDKLLKFACNENPELLVECVVQLGTWPAPEFPALCKCFCWSLMNPIWLGSPLIVTGCLNHTMNCLTHQISQQPYTWSFNF